MLRRGPSRLQTARDRPSPCAARRARQLTASFSKKENVMKAGAHVSTSGGPASGFERAEAIGAEAIQIFLTPPQQWRSSKVDDEGAAEFRARHKDSPVGEVFVHGVYLINLAASDSTMLQRSTSSLKSAMYTCSQLGAEGVIFH